MSRTRLLFGICLLIALLLGLQTSAFAGTYNWTGPTSGTANWNNAANWNSGAGGYPNAQDDVANLMLGNTGDLTVNLNEPITIGTLNTGNTSATILAPNGGALTFDVSAGDAEWTHAPTGNATFDIAAPVFLDDSIKIYNNRTEYSARQLIGGDIAASSAGTKTMKWLGQKSTPSGGQPYIRIGGAITDGAGQLAITCQPVFGGPVLYLDSNSNTFTGEVKNSSSFNNSDLIVNQSNSLGSPSAGTTVMGGKAVLFLRASVIGEALTLRGYGSGGGSLFNDMHANTWGGLITLVGDAGIGTSDYSGANLTIDVASGNAIEGDHNLIFRTGAAGFPITVNDPIATGPGGLAKEYAGTLFLDALNTYYGDTTVNGGTLSTTVAYLDDASEVSIASGALMNLNFTGNDVIAELWLNGVAQGPGTYNSTTDPGYFTGTGSLQIVPEPSTFVLTALGALCLIPIWRRRK